MTDTRSLHGRILTPLGWRRGQVHFDSQVRQLQVDDHSGGDDPQLLLGRHVAERHVRVDHEREARHRNSREDELDPRVLQAPDIQHDEDLEHADERARRVQLVAVFHKRLPDGDLEALRDAGQQRLEVRVVATDGEHEHAHD